MIFGSKDTPDGGKKVALASYPRSGNTWVRFLLEQSAGQLCGSVYKDRIMPRGKDGIAIKTHDLDSADYTHAILIVRNPYDVIESYYHWKRDIAGKKDVDWDQHVRQAAGEWKAHTLHWLNARCDRYRVRYEDLHQNTNVELAKLLDWLGLEKVTPEQVAAAIQSGSIENMRKLNPDLGEKFFRSGKVGASHERYTPEQRAWLARELGDLLALLGYTPLPA